MVFQRYDALKCCICGQLKQDVSVVPLELESEAGNDELQYICSVPCFRELARRYPEKEIDDAMRNAIHQMLFTLAGRHN